MTTIRPIPWVELLAPAGNFEKLEVFSPGRPIATGRIQSIRDDGGALMEVAHPGFTVRVGLSCACRRWDLRRVVRRRRPMAGTADDRDGIRNR